MRETAGESELHDHKKRRKLSPRNGKELGMEMPMIDCSDFVGIESMTCPGIEAFLAVNHLSFALDDIKSLNL